MEVVLNELTKTAHKPKREASDLHTQCGITHHLTHDQVFRLSAERATIDYNASKCGRCFDEGGGY